jgi:cytochrome c-type biogenesis protein CcmH/NrfF
MRRAAPALALVMALALAAPLAGAVMPGERLADPELEARARNI